ncbi:MAG: hypothetical protein OQJ78_08195 [Ignavibacteriaceae bacterium]|jgi:hypothetical protein|nr:hypothetical protein [Ignavibacteriaceae bacterium]
MKSLIIIILLSLNLFAQDSSIIVRDHEIKLGMNIDDVWDMLGPDFNVIEDEAGNFFVSDNKDNPVCVVYFKNEKAVKIIKDWGTTFKTNAGQVFKTLWIILKEHEKDLNSLKIIPQQTYTADGDKSSIVIYLKENRYIEITIRFNVTILEILELKES